jgi:hypothetical protein
LRGMRDTRGHNNRVAAEDDGDGHR